MATNDAAFSSFEESVCKYIAFGGTTGFTGGLPGMITSPSSNLAFIRLLKASADHRAAIPAYPTPFTTDMFAVRGIGEPTTAEWGTAQYSFGASAVRVSGSGGTLEVVDLGSGDWCVRNKAANPVVFTTPAPSAAGAALLNAVLCLPRFNPATSKTELYALMIANLDTQLDATPGGTNLSIPELRFRVL